MVRANRIHQELSLPPWSPVSWFLRWFCGAARARRWESWCAHTLLEMIYGCRPAQLSPHCVSINPDYEDMDMCVIQGGYGRLIDKLQQQLACCIDQNQTVQRIVITAIGPNNNQQVVMVHTEQGETFVGSHVLVTVPLGVLKAGTISFDPPLSRSKQEAIAQMGFGRLEKILLRFEQPFWRRNSRQKTEFIMAVSHDHHPDEGHGYTTWEDITKMNTKVVSNQDSGNDSTTATGSTATAQNQNQAKPTPLTFPSFVDMTKQCHGIPVLGVFYTNQIKPNNAMLIQHAMQQLQTMFPTTFQPPVQTHCTWWAKDPFALGCYFAPGLETTRQHYDDLARPEGGGCILFAGEATSARHAGYVGGAMESGIREAQRILGKPVNLQSLE
ncbi:hypothetical protein ACA910_007589 [Epithemia clementina (nom. ined.)]